MTAGAAGPEQGDPQVDPREQQAGADGHVDGALDADQAARTAGSEPGTAPGDPDASASDLTTEDLLAEAATGDEALRAVQTLAEERLGDLQRLQAEYVNYRRRVDRDRDVSAASARASVFEALLPVLDDVVLARTHGGLSDGPAASITDKLESTLERLGLERYGEAGEPFDPAVHEALMHGHADGLEVTTVTQVLQPGYRAGGRVLRAARVAVADPQ